MPPFFIGHRVNAPPEYLYATYMTRENNYNIPNTLQYHYIE